MLPIIQKEIVENKGLISEEEFMDAIALAQASPGPVAVNTSVYVGYRIMGFKGALSATLGAVLPSFLIILLIAAYFIQFRDNQIVERVFLGIRPAIVALILAAVYKMWIKTKRTYLKFFVAIGTIFIIIFLGISPVWVVIAGALVSVIYHKFILKIDET